MARLLSEWFDLNEKGHNEYSYHDAKGYQVKHDETTWPGSDRLCRNWRPAPEGVIAAPVEFFDD